MTTLFNPSHDNMVLALRSDFSSSFSNNTNGVVLGLAELRESLTTGGYYLDVDTMSSQGPPIIHLPKNQQTVSLYFTGLDEDTIVPNELPDYEIILCFKVIKQ